jgi:hypothetical protein
MKHASLKKMSGLQHEYLLDDRARALPRLPSAACSCAWIAYSSTKALASSTPNRSKP